MITLVIIYLECAVYLLKQNYAHKLMRKRYPAEAEAHIRAALYLIAEPQRAADNESDPA